MPQSDANRNVAFTKTMIPTGMTHGLTASDGASFVRCGYEPLIANATRANEVAAARTTAKISIAGAADTISPMLGGSCRAKM